MDIVVAYSAISDEVEFEWTDIKAKKCQIFVNIRKESDKEARNTVKGDILQLFRVRRWLVEKVKTYTITARAA